MCSKNSKMVRKERGMAYPSIDAKVFGSLFFMLKQYYIDMVVCIMFFLSYLLHEVCLQVNTMNVN